MPINTYSLKVIGRYTKLSSTVISHHKAKQHMMLKPLDKNCIKLHTKVANINTEEHLN